MDVDDETPLDQWPDAPTSNPSMDHSQLVGEEDDVELWLIKVPPKLRLDRLDGEKVKLSAPDGQGRIGSVQGFSVHTADPVEFREVVNLFPSQEDDSWKLGKPFTHMIQLIESIDVPLGARTLAHNPLEPRVIRQPPLSGKFLPCGYEAPPKGLPVPSIDAPARAQEPSEVIPTSWKKPGDARAERTPPSSPLKIGTSPTKSKSPGSAKKRKRRKKDKSKSPSSTSTRKEKSTKKTKKRKKAV